MLTVAFRCLLLMMCFSALMAQQRPRDGAITVCQLAENPAKYSGMQVTIKGRMAFGVHGSALVDRACPTLRIGHDTYTNAVLFGAAESDGPGEPLKCAAELFLHRTSQGKETDIEGTLTGPRWTPKSGQ